MKDYEIDGLVGIAYSSTSTTIETGLNCWRFMSYVQSRYYGRTLPEFDMNAGSDALTAMHLQALNEGFYRQVSSPQDGDCVLLRGGEDPHVGVWLSNDGGGVIHSQEPVGVVWTRERQLSRLGYARRTFYRVRNNDCKCHSTD